MSSPVWRYRRDSAYSNPVSRRHRRHVKRRFHSTDCIHCVWLGGAR